MTRPLSLFLAFATLTGCTALWALDESAESAVPKGFTVVDEAPFRVIGDESPDVVKQRAQGTVRWATARLKAQYFDKDPAERWDVWLFANDRSYRHHAKLLFDDTPDTPYGYATDEHHALVMNISTGGGTLIHEMVHPFLDANFPRVPSWFNEGLASLYEQSADRNGQIVGLTNWRLAGLQQAITANRVPSFRALTSTTTNEFYNRDPGTHYAQARYLCYYLQEHGKLQAFYQQFRKNVGTDPTGYETLKSVLGRQDMLVWQTEWEAWIMDLRFR